MTIISWNKGNSKFLNRLPEIQQIAMEHKPDIIAIQEANISGDVDLGLCQLEGYEMEVDQLYEKFKLARAVTYISQRIKYTRLKQHETPGEPVIWIQVYTGGNKKFLVQNYYRQWRQIENGKAVIGTESPRAQNVRFKNITNKWATLLENEEEVISISDTNIDLDKDYSKIHNFEPHEKVMITPLQTIGHPDLQQGGIMDKNPPHQNSPQKKYTNIDHMFTNQPHKITTHQVLNNGASDHLILKYTRTAKNQMFFPKYTMFRDYQKICWQEIKANLRNDPKLSLAEQSDNPDVIAESLITAINFHLNSQQPIKRVQTSKKLPKFASPETILEINKRDQALKRSSVTKNEEDIRQYKNSRNRVHKMLSKDKKIEIKTKLENAKNNPRQQWNTVKTNLGWNKNLSPNVISIDGNTITDPRGIAQAINVAHITRNAKLHREIPQTKTDPIENFKKLVKNKNLSFSLKNTSMHELRQVLKQMKPTPSTGVDGISVKTLKNLLPTIEKAILNLVNTTIGTTQYPKSLKIAKIVPLLKQGKPPNDPLSFRGINLLPSLGKVVDKIISSQIVRHLNLNKLLLHNHFGAIRGRSTIAAIATMLDDWVYDLESGENLAILILDQSAAYDLISHQILVKKLKILGFDDHAAAYFENYLKNRSQKVIVDTFESDQMYIGPMSVCQGSTLSGLLYLIYTLDLPLVHHSENHSLENYEKCKSPKTTTFVDDSAIKITLKNDQNQHNQQIKNTLNEIYDYMNANKLVLNQSKSKILVISQNPAIRQQISIKIPGKKRTPSTC